MHTFQRKGQTVLYLKGAQQISDCLALMGASGSVFALEDVRIRKQARGAANRAINCDEHNSEKMLNAAQQQVSAIRWYTIAHGLPGTSARLAGNRAASAGECRFIADRTWRAA